MKFLSDKAVDRLRQNADLPDLSGTRYQLLERVARGGMGTVYAARDETLDRRVAFKVLDVPVSNGDLARRLNREARVLALANAHRLITEGGWRSTSLMELLNTLLAPFLDRISFGGPNVFLEPDPTFGLSMAVHELVSNAGKHGSLSEPGGGRVSLTWSVTRTEQGLTLVLDWKESGGPAPKRSRRPGFGTRLINMVIERQLNGEVEQSFGAEGLEVKLIVPLTHERWPGSARTTASGHATG